VRRVASGSSRATARRPSTRANVTTSSVARRKRTDKHSRRRAWRDPLVSREGSKRARRRLRRLPGVDAGRWARDADASADDARRSRTRTWSSARERARWGRSRDACIDTGRRVGATRDYSDESVDRTRGVRASASVRVSAEAIGSVRRVRRRERTRSCVGWKGGDDVVRPGGTARRAWTGVETDAECVRTDEGDEWIR